MDRISIKTGTFADAAHWEFCHVSANAPKIIFDVGKTMSYAGKIISDIIQITSDLFLPFANV